MTVHWKDQALCKGMTTFFFPQLGDQTPQNPGDPSKDICTTCPVQQQCLEAGLNEYHGIWGGKSERERRVIRKERGYDSVLERSSRAS